MKQFLIALAVLVAACSSSRPEPVAEASIPHDHAAEAASPGTRLAPDEFDAAAPVSVAEAAKAAGRAEAPVHVEHDEPAARGAEPVTIYACPMHPEVTSETPGKCPKCGMTLVQRSRK